MRRLTETSTVFLLSKAKYSLQRVFLYLIYTSFPLVLSLNYINQDSIKLEVYQKVISNIIIVVVSYFLSQSVKPKIARFLSLFFISSTLFVFNFLDLVSYYLQGESFNERFLYQFNLSMVNESIKLYPFIFLFCLLSFSFVFFIDSCFLNGKDRFFFSKLQAFLLILADLFLISCTPNSLNTFILSSWNLRNEVSLANIEEIKSRLIQEKFDLGSLPYIQNKMLLESSASDTDSNLVLIYLESFEKSYLDESIFPDLAPNIKKLIERSVDFTNIIQIPNASWTMAGIFASQCAVPITHFKDSSINELDLSHKLVICLGDILNSAGYYQVFMGGASLNFADKGLFFKSHGYDEVLGLHELKMELDSRQYRHEWGLYDDTLFDLALEKYERLSKMEVPFNLTLLTLDTHHPNGFHSKTCKKYGKQLNQMLDSIHCTDQLIGKFINEISKRQNSRETKIVLLSDHLAMNNVARYMLPEDSNRKMLFFILGEKKLELNVVGSHYDIPSVLLETLGIRTNAKFVYGSNLLSPIKNENVVVPTESSFSLLYEYLSALRRNNSVESICQKIGFDEVASILSFDESGLRKEVFKNFGEAPEYKRDLLMLAFTESGQVQKISSYPLAQAVEEIRQNPKYIYLILNKDNEDPISGKWDWKIISLNYSISDSGAFYPASEKIDLRYICREKLGNKLTTQLPLVAHGGGEVDLIKLTNSFEALEKSRSKGITYYEIDFALTKESIPICIHDWQWGYKEALGVDPMEVPVSYQNFQFDNGRNKYKVCDANSLLTWLRSNPNARIIVDTKEKILPILEYLAQNYGQNIDQVIPQIYEPSEYRAVRELGFKSIIWTLYKHEGDTRDIIQNLNSMDLFALTLPEERAKPELMEYLKLKEIKSYVHTVNSPDKLGELFSKGVDSVYTDSLDINGFNLKKAEYLIKKWN